MSLCVTSGEIHISFFNDLYTKFILEFYFPFIIIFLGVQVVATAIAAILIDRLGRRVLLLSSALVMIFSLYGLGLYFWMLEHNPAEAGQLGFLPLRSSSSHVFTIPESTNQPIFFTKFSLFCFSTR